jgi:cysteine-rich repeat protein
VRTIESFFIGISRVPGDGFMGEVYRGKALPGNGPSRTIGRSHSNREPIMRHLPLLLILALTACNTGTDAVTPDAAGAGDAGPGGDSTPDGGGPDRAAPDVPESETGPDAGWSDVFEDAVAACEPGAGCFMDPCGDNADCLSGWCVQHMGEDVCTQPCAEECPPGWSCKQVGASDPDVLFICVSNLANLCRPCAAAADCESLGGAQDVCVAYGPEAGAFCGGACEDDGDCPGGYSCADVQTIDGLPTRQCVNDLGECPCTGSSAALVLWTPCTLENDVGACPGKRFCGGDGLTACDAPAAAAEICDGADNDCDGAIDEETCDDANPCTGDACLGVGGCEHDPLDGVECLDGDPCTVTDQCVAGICVGVAVNCDDGNPCTDDACQETGGCEHAANTLPCDDGDPCTLGDHCAEGACGGAALDCDDSNPCTDDSCGPSGCLHIPNEAPCDDGNPCTQGDLCAAGACAAGDGLDCDDGDLCTTDSCDPELGCLHQLNEDPCDDGDLCTTGDHCHLGVCIAAGALLCDDGNLCTDDGCDPLLGCQFSPNAAPCDDGNPCTVGDHCAGGWCVVTGGVDCDDGNPCTDDACEPVGGGCVHAPNVAPCDDGDACTVMDLCAGGACAGAGAPDCDDGNPCTDDACSPQSGCTHALNAAPCDDGDACSVGDVCMNGTCAGPVALVCDDGDPCTTDSCDPAAGCTFEAFAPCCSNGVTEAPGETCDDGNLEPGDGCDGTCQLESVAVTCTAPGVLVSAAPGGTMALCDDPGDGTCEEAMGGLCPSGWHLCSHAEYNHRNGGWTQSVGTGARALGTIQCRTGGGAGHFTVPDAGSGLSSLGQDEVHNCYYGSSRPTCTSGYGCNEKQGQALCCKPSATCGNGVVDGPDEVCDDGNTSESDDCLDNCTKRLPGGGGTNC